MTNMDVSESTESIAEQEEGNTHCRLRAALSLVWSQVHWLLDVAHCEHVGSTPSHLIFLRLEEAGAKSVIRSGPRRQKEGGARDRGARGHSGERRSSGMARTCRTRMPARPFCAEAGPV